MIINKLVIDRSKWGSGSLIRTDGRMCCLGHASVACGVLPVNMTSFSFPLSTWNTNSWLRAAWTGPGADRVALAAKINDNDNLSWQDKEPLLIKLFGDNGIELTFIGEGYQKDK